jgi:hypothetical protein
VKSTVNREDTGILQKYGFVRNYKQHTVMKKQKNSTEFKRLSAKKAAFKKNPNKK